MEEAPAVRSSTEMQRIKKAFCAVNILFVIVGILIVFMGVSFYKVNPKYAKYLGPYYFFSANLFFIAGFVIIFVVICGSYGVYRDSTCIILTFVNLLMAILICELVALVYVYVFKDTIIQYSNEQIRNATQLHHYDTEYITRLQDDVQCCMFIKTIEWWKITTYESYLEDDFFWQCRKKGYSVVNNCHQKLARFVTNSAVYVIIIGTLYTAIQVGGIFFIFKLLHRFKKEKTQASLANILAI